jgi:hypothetical protein
MNDPMTDLMTLFIAPDSVAVVHCSLEARMEVHRVAAADLVSRGQHPQHPGSAPAASAPLPAGGGFRLLRLPRRPQGVVVPLGISLGERDHAVLTHAWREGRITAGQARRWYWPEAKDDRPARNRLSKLKTAGLLVHVAMGRHQDGLYVPTADAGAAGAVDSPLSPPPVPATRRALTEAGHDLLVADVGVWLTRRPDVAPGREVRWLTGRELARERRGGGGYQPDGALVLPTGERFAVEVELTDKAVRLALPGGKLDWYRTAGYRGVWWLVPGPPVGRPLERAIAARGYTPDDMWVETLPPEAQAWTTE